MGKTGLSCCGLKNEKWVELRGNCIYFKSSQEKRINLCNIRVRDKGRAVIMCKGTNSLPLVHWQGRVCEERWKVQGGRTRDGASQGQEAGHCTLLLKPVLTASNGKCIQRTTDVCVYESKFRNSTGSFLLSCEFTEVTDTMVIQDLNEVGIKGQPYQIVYYSLPLYTPL